VTLILKICSIAVKCAFRPDGCNNSQLQQNIEQAKKIMEPFVLRRLKKDVLKDLPCKTNHTLNVTLSPAQNEIYKDLVSKFFSTAAQEEPGAEVSELGDDAEEGESTATNGQSGGLSGSMGLMMLMRRAANHPTLLRCHYTDHKIKSMAKKLLKDKTYKENREESIRLDLMEMSDHQIHQLCRIHPCIAECALPDQLLLDSGKFRDR
jgi:SWI/SNF-related matrix-associated actin-dependent regulator of chromatin subfamily A containing DEAD/H box 1